MAAKAAIALPQLQAWRVRRCLSPGELAKAADVNRFTVYHAERGERVHFATVRKLAAALGVNPEQLWAEEPEKVATA